MKLLTNIFLQLLLLWQLVLTADPLEHSLGDINLTPGLRARIYEADVPDDATSSTRYTYLGTKQYLTSPGKLLGQANGITNLDINYVKGISPTIYGIEIDPSIDKFVVELRGYYLPKEVNVWKFFTMTWASEGCYNTFEPSMVTTTSSLRRNMYLNPDGTTGEMMCYQDNDVKIVNSGSSNEVSSGTSTPIGVNGGGSNNVEFPINRYYPFKIVLLSRGGSFNVQVMISAGYNKIPFDSSNIFSNPDEDYIYTDANSATEFPGNCPVFTGDKSSGIVAKFRQLVKRDYCESLLSSSSVEPEPSSTSEPSESSTDPVVPSATEPESSSTTDPVESSTSEVESSSTVEPIETSTEPEPSSTVDPVESSTAELEPSSTVEPIETSSEPEPSSTVDPIESSTSESVPSSTIDPIESSTSEPVPSSTVSPVETSSEPEPEPSSTVDPWESSTDPVPSSTEDPNESSTEIIPSSTEDPQPSATEDPVPSSIEDPEPSATEDPVPSSTEDPIGSTTDPVEGTTTPSPDSSTVNPPDISTEMTTVTEWVTSTTIERPGPDTTVSDEEVDPTLTEMSSHPSTTLHKTTSDGEAVVPPPETKTDTNTNLATDHNSHTVVTVTTYLSDGSLYTSTLPLEPQVTTDNHNTETNPGVIPPGTTVIGTNPAGTRTVVNPAGTNNPTTSRQTTVLTPGIDGGNNGGNAGTDTSPVRSDQKNPTGAVSATQSHAQITEGTVVQATASSRDQWGQPTASTLAPYEGSANTLPLQPIVFSIILLIGIF